jgi:penicillin-binding protein 1A
MGITSPLDETPALALGSSDVNLLELTGAYCTIVDDGRQHDPCLVTRIVDKDDREVYVAPLSTEQSIPYKSAYLMQDLLKSGLTERGATSMSLWGYIGKYHDAEFGGKTGTSNNHSDAWFMGVSPKLVVGAWVGGEYRCIHFRTGALGQGSRTALPICGYFLESVLGDPAFKHYRARFEKPKDPDITSDMYTCQTYYAPRSYDFEDDSLGLDDELILDDEGNPIPQEEPVYTEEPVATEQKEL